MPFISCRLHGGLGNRLFQIVASYARALRYGREFLIVEMEQNGHSTVDYFTNIFSKFAKDLDLSRRKEVQIVLYERLEDVWAGKAYPDVPGKNVLYYGYFQTEYHFKDLLDVPRLRELLCMDKIAEQMHISSRFRDCGRAMFMHVRRGDYLSAAHNVHLLDLRGYYERALEFARRKLEPGWKLYIVSDDVSHCKTLQFRGIEHEVVEGLDEVGTLALMASCKLGGICANSSFSWWGSYLNSNPQKLVLFPSQWWQRQDIRWDGMYYEGAHVIEII
jgi:hypothetical protein